LSEFANQRRFFATLFLKKASKENLKADENVLFLTSPYPLLQTRRGKYE